VLDAVRNPEIVNVSLVARRAAALVHEGKVVQLSAFVRKG
jgi:hypothetical protein